MIIPKIKDAISASLQAFATVTPVDVDKITEELYGVFDIETDFLSKVKALDIVFDDYPKIESLREVFFDLLLVNFFSADIKKLDEDYLDSAEWEKIEEKTLDRGTELLNVLLYLNECDDEEIEPGLEDYLKEFLLVEDDEFQDEHRIYEQMIANQALMESSVEEIGNVARSVPEDSEIKELFYPVMCFFYEVKPSEEVKESIKTNAVSPNFDLAVLAIVYQFN
ncbi:MAG: hypothetical protein ACOH2A_04510 [Sphingobacteriaceae bacterium]